MAEKNYYRKEALAKLSMPEVLDKSLPVTKPRYWVITIGAVIVLLAGIMWGFFGHLNITLDVPGVAYTPGYANEYVCEDTGILTTIFKGQGRFIRAGETVYEYRDNVNSKEIKQWKSPVTGMISTISIYPGAEIYPGKKALMIKSFVNEENNGSTIVDVLESHNKNDSYSDYQKIVYAFVPINNFGIIKQGLDVEVWPVTSDKFAHGHMVGKIAWVNAFIASDDDIKSIIGLDSEIKQLEDMGNVGICGIALQEDPNTESGFYWTSPNGATQTLNEGDVVNASIITGRTNPIGLLFQGL